MAQVHMLTRHRDIRNWVAGRHGSPAFARRRDRFGEERSELTLRFASHEEGREDAGMSPCSWNAWLAELDRQQLALRVDPTGRCTIVAREAMN